MQVKPLSSVLCQVHQMYMKLQILVLLRHVAQHDRHVCVREFKQQEGDRSSRRKLGSTAVMRVCAELLTRMTADKNRLWRVC